MLKIKKLELKNYNRFKSSNIKKFELNVENETVVITSGNGSGKSSLLLQLNINTPISTDFKKGSRVLTIIKDDFYFVLSSDFKMKNKAHSFKRDNIELNESKNTNIQNNLIEEYLGIDDILMSILNFEFDLSSMKFSERKKVLLGLNPIKLDIFIDQHKVIRQDLNKCKNNLSMLFDRKSKLENQLLDIEDFKIIKTESKFLGIRKNNSLSMIAKLQNIMELETTEIIDKVNLEDIKKQYKHFINTIYTSDISKIDKISILEKDKSVLINEKTNSDNLINGLLSEIEEYESYKNNYNNIEKSLLVERNLKNIEALLGELLTVEANIENKFILEQKTIILDELERLVVKFIESESKVINDDELIKLEKTINNNELELYGLRSNNLLERIKNLDNDELIIIPDNCSKLECSLYQSYADKRKTKVDKLKSLNTELLVINNQTNKLELETSNLKILLEQQRYKHSLIKRCIEVLNEYPNIKILFNKEISTKILLYEVIAKEPSKIVNIVKAIFNTWENNVKKYNLLQDRDRLKIELKALSNNNTMNNDFVINILEKKKVEYKTHLLRNEKIVLKLSNLNNTLNRLNSIKAIIDDIKSMELLLKDNILYIERKESKKYYLNLYEGISNYSREIDLKLNNINQTVRDQEFLNERLKKEIIEPIVELSKKLDDLILLEKGLKDIVLIYVREFLNKLIEFSNFFLTKLFNYTIKIQTIKTGEIDFKFSVIIKNIIVSDISKLSAGEKIAIRICTCLALMIILEKTDYPIFLDEIDRAFDTAHKNRLFELLMYLLNNKIISQIFMISHDFSMSNNFVGDTVILDSENIVVPEIYNETVKINYY